MPVTGNMAEPFSMEAARLHARLPAHKRAVDRAVARVKEALALHPGEWAVCASGGKDSTALIGVAVAAGWKGPVFHFTYRETPQQNTEQVSLVADLYGLQVDKVIVPGAFDIFDELGFFPTPETEEQIKATARMDRAYKHAASKHQKMRGWAGIMMGMRTEESQRRRLMLISKGHLYSVEDRPCMTCCPLMDWSSRDVWGFISSHGLPYLRRYDEGDRTSQSSRSEEIWLAMDAWAKGQGEKLRRSDPLMWAELVRKFPQLAHER